VVRSVAQKGQRWDILKINQYESKFQSMSVLVRNCSSRKYFVFAKGSPEMIHSHSRLQHQGFHDFVKKLSLEGYRSIGFSFREVPEGKVQQLLAADRAEFLQHTAILGLVTFVNLIKPDARKTIEALRECDIGTKIITGDNIFLGIQTAFAAGMIPESARVTVLEGRNFDAESGAVDFLTLFKDT
jgi:cation-transporting P-type ATPase 13A2